MLWVSLFRLVFGRQDSDFEPGSRGATKGATSVKDVNSWLEGCTPEELEKLGKFQKTRPGRAVHFCEIQPCSMFYLPAGWFYCEMLPKPDVCGVKGQMMHAQKASKRKHDDQTRKYIYISERGGAERLLSLLGALTEGVLA